MMNISSGFDRLNLNYTDDKYKVSAGSVRKTEAYDNAAEDIQDDFSSFGVSNDDHTFFSGAKYSGKQKTKADFERGNAEIR